MNDKQRRRQGQKRCPRCGQWKSHEEFGHRPNGQFRSYCRPCRRDYDREWQAKHRHRRRSAAVVGNPQHSAVLDLIGSYGPPQAQDSLKYACMDVGFAHRPIPIGETKRQAFCANCTALRCVHHPELTPDQVKKDGPIASRYPEKSIICALHEARIVNEPVGENAERDLEIIKRYHHGESTRSIAEDYPITRQRVHQIVQKARRQEDVASN